MLTASRSQISLSYLRTCARIKLLPVKTVGWNLCWLLCQPYKVDWTP
jgi:hypothetical protein